MSSTTATAKKLPKTAPRMTGTGTGEEFDTAAAGGCGTIAGTAAAPPLHASAEVIT